MAQCKLTAEEFIQDVFSPLVAVLCSNDVENVCLKNNLSFIELIQPFCSLATEAMIRDSNNVVHPIRNLRVIIHDMNAVQPPSTLLSQKLLSDAVSNALPQSTSSADILPNTIVTVGNHDLQLSAMTPWFEAYRDSFLQMAYPSDHEFLRHYLACMFVVSSSHPDPMEEFVRLTQLQHTQQHQQPHKLPKWFSPNILRYYVLVNDVGEHAEIKAETVYQLMKGRFGVQACHLLHINSCSPSSVDPTSAEQDALPSPWSRYVSRKQDLDESSEFESSFLLPDDNSGHFPGHVTEGTFGGSHISIDLDTAVEASEDSMYMSGSSSVVDHPLASSSRSASYDVLNSSDIFTMSSHGSLPNVANLSAVTHRQPDLTSSDGASTTMTRSQTVVGSRQIRYGALLTLSDHERLRVFINEFVVHGLIPWAEKMIRTLSEQVVTRKGIHRSFLSATKKWFGGGKQANPAVITNNTNVVYTAEAPEMQMRRLADLAFMFHLYEMAYQIYHAVKKDFNNENAWLHYAGAMEMACLAVFMQGPGCQRSYPFHYMDTTITTYLAVCKVPHFATRATLLSIEVLKSKGMYAEAASQLIKMTSEESDLRSALLLEQAAHCFIKMKTPMVRKYAFHMILAGHRFNKAWQKRHALRAYAQAMQVYKGRSWSLAEDHINFTIGCQSFNLKQMDIATSAFKHLLSVNSKQSLSQQTAFLREYLTVFKQLNMQSVNSDLRLPQLPLPVIESGSIKVLCGSLPLGHLTGSRIMATGMSFDESETENNVFIKLEEAILSSYVGNVGGSSSVSFKPTIECFTSRTNNVNCPVTAVGEPVTVELLVTNPLKVALVLRDVTLLWRFVANGKPSGNIKSEPVCSNESDFCKGKVALDVVDCQSIPEVHLEGAENKLLHLTLTAHASGDLQICSLAFRLSSAAPSASVSSSSVNVAPITSTPGPASSIPTSVAGFVTLEVQGARLNGSKDERTRKVYAADRRLNLVITEAAPKLEVFFCQFPSRLLCGEIRQATIDLVNTGSKPLRNVKVASTNPEFFTFGPSRAATDVTSGINEVDRQVNWPDSIYPVRSSCEHSGGCAVVRRSAAGCVCDVPLKGVTVEPGETVQIPVWVRGPDEPGEHSVDFLFYYEPTVKIPHIRHRLVRHMARVAIYQSLSVRAICNRFVCSSENVDEVQSNSNSVVIALEVENVNTIQDSALSEFSAIQASCLSRSWKLQPLGILKPADTKIHSRECMMFTLKAQQCLPTTGDPVDDYMVTDVSFGTVQLDAAHSVAVDFHFQSLTESSNSDQSLAVNHSSQSQITDCRSTPLDAALDVNMTLLLLWKTSLLDHSGETSVIVGQHNITLTHLSTLVSCPKIVRPPVELPPVKILTSTDSDAEYSKPTAELASQLIRYTMHHQSTVQHDFTKTKLCIVQIQLELLNCSRAKLTVDVDTHHSHSRQGATSQQLDSPLQIYNTSYHDRPSKGFSWVGPTVIRVVLGPNEVHTLALRACFISCGVYDLSCLRVAAAVPSLHNNAVVDDESNDFVIQRALSASLVVVSQPSDLRQ